MKHYLAFLYILLLLSIPELSVAYPLDAYP